MSNAKLVTTLLVTQETVCLVRAVLHATLPTVSAQRVSLALNSRLLTAVPVPVCLFQKEEQVAACRALAVSAATQKQVSVRGANQVSVLLTVGALLVQGLHILVEAHPFVIPAILIVCSVTTLMEIALLVLLDTSLQGILAKSAPQLLSVSTE